MSVGTLSSWVNNFGSLCMSPVEIAQHLNLTTHNRWSGILLLDGKYLNKKMILLLVVDYLTLDIVAHLVAKAETEEGYIKLMDMVEGCGYNIKALVSDGHPAILALSQSKRMEFRKGTRTYPRPGIPPAPKPRVRLEGTPHQRCVIHAKRELARKLANLSEGQKIHVRKLTQSVLFTNTLTGAKRGMRELIKATRSSRALHTDNAVD